MASTLKLVERQIAMLEIRRRLEDTTPQPGSYVTADGIAFGPCLLISRECGSGGLVLAENVGRQLGWNVFDSKIVDEIAQASHIHQRLVQSVDEHVHSRWEQTWREMLLEDLPDKQYLIHLKQVVMTLAHSGKVVLVGRGAQYFLPSRCGLRVRLVAPKNIRGHRLAERRGISFLEAIQELQRTDLERRDFVTQVFRRNIGLATDHDLVINTGRLSEEEVCHLVLAALKAKLGVEPPPLLKDHVEIPAAVHGHPSG